MPIKNRPVLCFSQVGGANENILTLNAGGNSADHFLPPKARALAFLSIMVAMLFSSAVHAQPTLDPGRGGTVAGFEVDAEYISGIGALYWDSTNYKFSGVYFDDWVQGFDLGVGVLRHKGGHGQIPGAGLPVPGTAPGGNAIWQRDGNWGSSSVLPELNTFSGSTNNNGDPIGPGQQPYSIQTGGSDTGKYDITNTMLHWRVDPEGDHVWLFGAVETRDPEGFSYLDIEYNHNGVAYAGSTLRGPANNANLNIINGRTVGDFILVIDYSPGSTKPLLSVRTWLANGTWSAATPINDTIAYIGINISQVSAPRIGYGFGADGDSADIASPLQLIEYGVDLTALNLLPAKANGKGTVTIKSRATASFTSALVDLTVLPFSLPSSKSALQNAAQKPVKLVPQTIKAAHVSVYPNPFSSAATIEFIAAKGGQASLEVYDLSGKLMQTLFSGQLDAGETRQVKIEYPALPNGLYFTRLTVDGQVLNSSKLVIQK